MTTSYILWSIGVSAFVTILLRAFPFLLFHSKKKSGPLLDFIAKNLPVTVIAILIIYSISHISFENINGYLKEFVAIASVVFLHLFKKNTLVSVLGGTIVYMVMIHLGF